MESNATETTPAPTIAPENNLEAKYAKLEAEKENYRKAYLIEVEKGKNRGQDETEDEKIRRIAAETLADSQITSITREQQALLDKALKENSELKLAALNKGQVTPPAAMGAHSESTPVTDTMVTPEQLAAFKARGWSDKDIERYKLNLRKKL